MPKGKYVRTKKYIEKWTGKNNHQWKGGKVGYRALHHWLDKNYGQPTTCEHCQTANLIGHQIHWANKSGEYIRNREDWLRLCAKCHKLFDKKTPDFCFCGNVHVSKGMCKRCYFKDYINKKNQK